jgi:hypothetical protein
MTGLATCAARLAGKERRLSDDVSSAVSEGAGLALTQPPDPLSDGSADPLDRPPAWRRPTRGEPRWISALAVVVAALLQLLIPDRLSLDPRYLLPLIELALLAVLVGLNPGRVERRDPWLRGLSLGLTGVIFAANAGSGVALVTDLLRGRSSNSPGTLLVSGGLIYAINVIVFALWFWELDRGGPVARAQGVRAYPDFLFPQMQAEGLVDRDWEPIFTDYLYVSFTNVVAFSPTDTLPLTRWTKLLMMLQATLAIALVVLVIARAVNVLK